MTYAAVHTATRAARTDGDVRGRVEIGLLLKAATRLPVVANDTDQRERAACRRILDGDTPMSWVFAVLLALDIAGVLANPTDPQVDTAVTTAWTYIIASRV